MLGWISIHRKILEHWIWTAKPYSKGQAWLDLLLKASHEKTDFLYSESLIHLNRGQVVVSHRKLSETWGWSKDKVSRFLTLLKNEGMVKIEVRHGVSIITICEYTKYQDDKKHNNDSGKDSDKDASKDSDKDTDKDTDKDKYNNINNINKNNKKTNNARAREKFFSYFCERIISGGDLTAVWNELNLKHLEVLDDDCLSVMFEAYLNRLHKEFPNLPSVDEVSSQEWGKAFNAILYPDIDPHHWAGHYLCHGFAEYITGYHRGMNQGQWIADIAYAFKPETMNKVYRQTGVY